MKKIALLSILLIFTIKSQSQIGGCNIAQNICTNPNFQFQGTAGNGLTAGLSLSNPGTNPQMGNGSNPAAAANSGCLLTNGPGPQWLILTVSVSGNLGFIFGAPSSANPQVGLYDWEMWPYTATTCADIFNNTLPPVSCNWNATNTGGTGMGAVPAGGNVGNYQPSIPVTAGQQFLILISNYSGVTTLVSFTSTGTASLTCGLNTAICAGTTTSVSPVGFTPMTNASYTLLPGGSTNLTGVFSVTPSISTTYTVIGSGLNTGSVQTTQTSTTSVAVNPQPISVPTTTQSTCSSTLSAFNLGLTFNPSNSVPGYTINWAPIPNGVTAPNQISASGFINSGLYTATITATGGCATVASFSINPQPAIPVFTITPFGNTFTVTCAQPTIVLTASDPTYNYSWNGPTAPQTSVSAEFTALNLGTWSVTATDPISTCTKVHTFTVSQNTSVPTLTVGPLFQTITCSNSAVTTITATSNPTLNIQHDILSPFGGSFTANSYTAVYSAGACGTYTSVLTNMINGCKAQKTFTVACGGGFPTFTVTSPSIPGVAGIAGNFTLGCGTHSVININIVNPQTTGSTSLPNGGVASCTLIPPFTTSYSTAVGAVSYTAAVPGTWTVIAKDPTSGCETKVPISVVQNTFGPQIEVTQLTTTLTCYTPTVQLQGLSTNTTVTFNWQKPSGNQAGSNLSVFGNGVSSNSTVATYILTGTDPNNTCKSTTAIPVYQNMFQPSVAIAANSKTITCITQTITLSNNSKVTSPSNFPTSSVVQGILWQGPPPQDDLQLSSSYVAGIAGVYTLTGKDETNGCIGQGTINVTDGKIYPVVNNPIAPKPFVLDCGSDTVTVKAIYTSPTSKFKYSWYIAQGTATTGVTTNSAFIVNSPGLYRVLVTDGDNGCATIGEVSVLNGVLKAELDANLVSGYAPLEVILYNNSASVNALGITSVWSFGNGTKTVTTSSNLSQTVVYNQPGTYTVALYATKGTCQSSATKTIVVDIPSKLEVPNVFTPNGDGSNDLFFVRSANLTEITAMIFDRWGHKIYELTSSTGNIAWDGKNQLGKDVPEGTYFYIITAKGKDNKDYDTKGNVSLYR
jgi:gliding motility-associated-like protein